MSPPARDTFAAALQLHRRGDLHQAEGLYRQLLAVAPNHADALHMLGLLNLQTGRHAAARDYLERAIAVAPRVAEAQNHLGLALQELGLRPDAEVAFRRAIKLQRSAAPAWLNLANLLAASGRAEEAIAGYRRAFAIDPRNAAARFNLAQLLARQGDVEGAETQYREGLRISPSDAAAHTALATLLHRSRRIDDAVAHFRTATELAPRSAGAFMNLGFALRDRGDMHGAARAAITAHALTPADVMCKSLFVDCAKKLDPAIDDDDVAADLARALTEAWDRPEQLAPAALRVLRADPEGLPAFERAASGNGEVPGVEQGGLNRPVHNGLLLTLLHAVTIADLTAERLFTVWRRNAVRLATAGGAFGPRGLRMLCGLAAQCFLNEYAWAETREETTAVAQLVRWVEAPPDGHGANTAAWIAVLGSYRPLDTIPGADRLLTRAWPAEVQHCLLQQIEEPREEARLQATLPRLTAIGDATSQRVRAQYEINPYPRWIRTVTAWPGGGVHDVLRQAVPGIDLEGDGPAAPDILVAGCGTGQHPIETARRFRNSRVLAIDLSLRSLAYAQRKTRESGIANIEYAQADILEIGTLTRRFDIVEAGGVLHHIGDPEAAWRTLLTLLRPGGLMKVALYSEFARAPVVRARAAIASHGFGTSADEIRRFRQEMPGLLDAPAVAALHASTDFYSISACRDMLFHVQVQRFTLPQIAAMLARLGLEFLGFELPSSVGPTVRRGPDALAHWHEFEQQYPTVFSGMYQFWVRRTPAAMRDATSSADPRAADSLAGALAQHRAGRLAEAEALYDAVLRENPDNPDALHLRGLVAHQRGDDAAAIALMRRALQHRPDFAIALNNLGNILRASSARDDATAAYRRALELNPNLIAADVGLAALASEAGDFDGAVRRLEATTARHPDAASAWCELGSVLRRQRRIDDAIAALDRAVAHEPTMFAAHNERGIALHEAGRWAEAEAAYRTALTCSGDASIAWRNLGHAVKRLGRTDEAVACYRRAAGHRDPAANLDAVSAALDTYMTTSQAKLAHDIEQFGHLAACGWRPHDAADLMARYRDVLAAIRSRGAPSETVRLTADERARLGPGYNRLLNVADAPAVANGPFGAWQPAAIEAEYLAARPELAVIDDFLSQEALEGLRRYCLESTVWFNFSHRGGYLAALLDDRFDCPLLMQIADELRRVMPGMLGRHSLVHAWAYKYDSTLEGVGIHGDNAAVNVNFWITPDAANLALGSGGMIVYPAVAPADWRFEDFNADTDRIMDFVTADGRAPIRIDYRANRAVVFNSSLFHETDRFRFQPGYDTRRINVTMLFGDRSAS